MNQESERVHAQLSKKLLAFRNTLLASLKVSAGNRWHHAVIRRTEVVFFGKDSGQSR